MHGNTHLLDKLDNLYSLSLSLSLSLSTLHSDHQCIMVINYGSLLSDVTLIMVGRLPCHIRYSVTPSGCSYDPWFLLVPISTCEYGIAID